MKQHTFYKDIKSRSIVINRIYRNIPYIYESLLPVFFGEPLLNNRITVYVHVMCAVYEKYTIIRTFGGAVSSQLSRIEKPY